MGSMCCRLPDGKKKIGLVTNQKGVDAEGRRTIDVLAHAPGVSLEAIFSPEHGTAGTLDTDRHSATPKMQPPAFPSTACMGPRTRQRRPAADVMSQLDAVVFDLQDAGVRFYTYETYAGIFSGGGG